MPINTSPTNRDIRMDIEKFTERARGFLQAASTIAIREFHQRITPENLLKALLDDEEGAAALASVFERDAPAVCFGNPRRD